MFSISANEFADLPTFIEKVSSSENVESNNDARINDIRTWCAEKGFLLHFSKTSGGEIFYTLKYDRAKLTEEQYGTVGRFRSVVFDSHGKVCCVAPPKMLKIKDEMKTCCVNSAGGYLSAEELVEGIMVNLFWYDAGNGGKWYIATKSCVGEVSFDHIVEAQAEAQLAEAAGASDSAQDDSVRSTFQKLNVQEVLRRRICDILSLLPGGLQSIPKEYCYSLVIQHPKNQIVNVITIPKLYLVAVYQLSGLESGAGTNVIRIDRDIFSVNFGGSVSHMPSGLTCMKDGADASDQTVDDYCNMYGSMDTRSVSLPGVVFVDKDTGFCYKKRNPKYESVKKRKGMEQKLMAQYLQLRKDHGIDEYLKYHPQHSRAFRQFRDRLHDYTQRLYDAYIEHYVKKDAKPLKEYDRELKTHMYKLHYDVYLATMKETGGFVTKHTVINYVNQLAAAQQLACLNATSGTTVATGAGTDAEKQGGTSAPAPASAPTSATEKKPFQRKPIERSKTSGSETRDAESKSGFRHAKQSRGGRMVPSLTVQIPKVDDTDSPSAQLKGSKGTGVIKVQNQFAGLDMDTVD